MPYKDIEAQRRYQRERLARIKAEWFLDKKCVRCETKKNLQLDHVDPAEKVSHRIWSWSKVRFDEEVRKCQVLCKECHIKKTKNDMGYGLKHGTYGGYNYYGCRCDLCKGFKIRAVNEWRWRTGKGIKQS